MRERANPARFDGGIDAENAWAGVARHGRVTSDLRLRGCSSRGRYGLRRNLSSRDGLWGDHRFRSNGWRDRLEWLDGGGNFGV